MMVIGLLNAFLTYFQLIMGLSEYNPIINRGASVLANMLLLLL